MAPKKVSKAQAKSESSNNSSSGRVLAITAVDGFTGSAVLELLMSDSSYKGKITKIIGLTFGEPKEDTKAVLDEYGVETALVDEMDEDKLKELGVDTLCLIPPARKVRSTFDPASSFTDTVSRAGQGQARQADPRARQEVQVGQEPRLPLVRRLRLRRARQAAAPPRVHRPRGPRHGAQERRVDRRDRPLALHRSVRLPPPSQPYRAVR